MEAEKQYFKEKLGIETKAPSSKKTAA